MKSKAGKLAGLAGEVGKKRPFDCLEQEAFLSLVRTLSVLSPALDRLLKKNGITGPQYNALRILRGHGKPTSVYQISDDMVSAQPDMPRLIDRMRVAGLVEKTRCQKDRRVVWVTLTKKGESVLKKIDQPLINLQKDQLKHMDEDQLKDLIRLLSLARHPA